MVIPHWCLEDDPETPNSDDKSESDLGESEDESNEIEIDEVLSTRK